MAKVSVIVPVYNVEKYLARCLDSITSQTFDDIEIICVNDGSTDSSGEILEHYKEFDDRIKIITKENGGLSSARNSGIETANGEFILFVDSDDSISSITVEVLYNYAKKMNSDVVIFDYVSYQYNTTNSPRIMGLDVKSDEIYNIDSVESDFYKYVPVSVWCKFYKSDLIKDKIKFCEDMIYEDVSFWAEVFVRAKRISHLKVPLYLYTIGREGQIMLDNGEKSFDVLKAYDSVEKTFRKFNYLDKFRHTINLLKIMDVERKFFALKPELRLKMYEAMKSISADIDYAYYDKIKLYDFEKQAIERFRLVNSSDYDTFCKIINGGVDVK